MSDDTIADASRREQTRTIEEADASGREPFTPEPPTAGLETENVPTRTDASRRERVRKPAPQNWIVIDRAMERLAAAGLPVKLRTVQKYCLRKKIHSELAVTDKNTVKYFLDPVSLEEFIAAEQQKVPLETGEADPAHAPRTPEVVREQTRTDAVGDASGRERFHDLDVYEHPYVKKLEDRVDKLEAKYEAQVRRTEEIQIQSQEKILELQRMTTIGQNKTLADFMLKAREWILGPGQGSEMPAKPGESEPSMAA